MGFSLLASWLIQCRRPAPDNPLIMSELAQPKVRACTTHRVRSKVWVSREAKPEVRLRCALLPSRPRQPSAKTGPSRSAT